MFWEKEIKDEFNKEDNEKGIVFSEVEKLLKMLKKTNNVRIIEIGAGSGIITLLLAQKLKFKPYLFDRSDKALQTSYKNANILGVEACFIKGDVCSLPFEENSFDFVWSGGLNEHFSGKQRQIVFNEMARITSPEGICVLTVPNKYYLPLNVYRYISQKRNTWSFGYEEPFSKKELKERMTKAGLSNIRIIEGGFFSGLIWLMLLIPILRKKVSFNHVHFKKIWNLFQYLDHKLKIIPGLGFLAYGSKYNI
ncbi:MAG: class I SAM-dependent methyltransferase [Nitrospirota bacterium]